MIICLITKSSHRKLIKKSRNYQRKLPILMKNFGILERIASTNNKKSIGLLFNLVELQTEALSND